MAVAHALLGLLSAAALWIRPGTFTPHLPSGYRGYLTFEIFWNTASGWLPYVISWFFAKTVLDARPPSATLTFIGAAILITLLLGLFQSNVFGFNAAPSPLLLSIGTTFALVMASGICAQVWQADL